jgi:hypothetical protein
MKTCVALKSVPRELLGRTFKEAQEKCSQVPTDGGYRKISGVQTLVSAD